MDARGREGGRGTGVKSMQYVWPRSSDVREEEEEGEGEGGGRERGQGAVGRLASSTYASVVTRSLPRVALLLLLQFLSFACSCFFSFHVSHGFELAHPSLPKARGKRSRPSYLEWTGRRWTPHIGNHQDLVKYYISPNGFRMAEEGGPCG